MRAIPSETEEACGGTFLSRSIVPLTESMKKVNSPRSRSARVRLAVSMALTAWALPGAPARSDQTTPGVGPKVADAPVRIDGSNGVLPLAAALRRGFEARHDGSEVVLGGGLGGRARIEALASGSIDVALASHGLDFEDLGRRGMTAHRVAVTPVVFAVHADVPVRQLTARDLCDIYGGKVTHWSALGGPDLRIRAFLRPESEVDTEIVRARLPCMRELVVADVVMRPETTMDMVKALQDTSGAIGLTTSTVVRQSSVALRSLSLDGVSPTPENVTGGRYNLVRPAYFVTLASPPPSVRRFLDFVRSEAGAAIILDNGALSVS